MRKYRRVRRRRGRLPHDRVAHHRRGRCEVAADGREVERADREDEALERPVLHAVPDTWRGRGLLLVDADEVVGVEAPEVDHFAGGVDLGLVHGLRLVEHRGRIQRLDATGRREAPMRGGRPPRAPPTASATTRAMPRQRRRSPLAPPRRRPGGRLRATCSLRWGMTDSNVVPVRTSLPPITHGISDPLRLHLLEPRLDLGPLGLPAVYARTGSFNGGGGRKMPWTLTRRF